MREYLGKAVDVTVDRPLGSTHPKYKNMIYPVNYGYIPNTIAGDGMEVDAYILGEFYPLDKYQGVVIAIIKRFNDNEDKLVVASSLDSFTIEQIKALTQFQERFFDSEIICYDVKKDSIRPTAKGIVRRGDEVLLIHEKEDGYYRLLGGGIEFNEHSTEALIREFKEEIGVDIMNYEFQDILENRFTFKGMNIHELCVLYEVELSAENKNQETYVIRGESIPAKAEWVKAHDFKTKKKKVLPEQVLIYL